MRAELQKILRTAMAHLEEHIRGLGGRAKRGLENTDEATFRSMVLRALMTRLPDAECQTEWKRYDLLVQAKGLNVLIEFKFYVSRLFRSLGGEHAHFGRAARARRTNGSFGPAWRSSGM